MNEPRSQDLLEKFNNAWPHLNPFQRALLLTRIYWYLAVVILQRHSAGWMHGWLTPERRTVNAHWIGSNRKRVRSLRPVDLLFPAVLSQLVIFASASHAEQPVSYVLICNIILAGIAMLPSMWKKQNKGYRL